MLQNWGMKGIVIQKKPPISSVEVLWNLWLFKFFFSKLYDVFSQSYFSYYNVKLIRNYFREVKWHISHQQISVIPNALLDLVKTSEKRERCRTTNDFALNCIKRSC